MIDDMPEHPSGGVLWVLQLHGSLKEHGAFSLIVPVTSAPEPGWPDGAYPKSERFYVTHPTGKSS